MANGRSDRLDVGVSILVRAGRIAWMGRAGDEPDPGDARVVDAGGSTVVPSLVDAHAHLSLPGGSHWIDRGFDDAAELTTVCTENAALALRAGVRWIRDVGSPARVDATGRNRAVALQVRDAWADRGRDVPYIRAAGTWVARTGTLPDGLAVTVDDGDGLVAAALRQLDDGADLVKLYADGPDPETAPFTASELRAVVAAARERGARVTAHATRLAGARACADAGVAAIEHGFELDREIAATMASNGVFLVSTLAVMRSWQSFATTSNLERFTGEEGRAAIAERQERAKTSLRLARDAGVAIAAGTDFGGGSLRANQLAWEVEEMVDAGLSPREALAAVTWRGGELLGEPGAGVLRPGGPPDFFLVHGDPLTDPDSLWRVWRVA